MKKLVTTLTASALLMGSLATAVSAAETTTPSVTDATYTPGTVGGTVIGTTNPNSEKSFQSTDSSFYFTQPASWTDRVKYQEWTADQLTANNQNGTYLATFTYQPQFTTKAGNTLPLEIASIRGYSKTAWDAITNKNELGTIILQNDDTVYVLEIPNNSDQVIDETDIAAFNALKADFLNNVTKTFGFGVAPVTPTPNPNPSGTPVLVNDPSKVSTNPTPNIELTSMTPFYKSPGGTMIGYLGPQKLDTTGNGTTDPASGQWVEIYTWMGLAWIVVE